MPEITTSTGATITIKDSEYGPVVVLDHPEAPEGMRHEEVGRLIEMDGLGFQPAPFAAWALKPETLRAIADLIDRRGDPR